MAITHTSTQPPGVPRTPLDNPQRAKPRYASDEECAELLAAVLQDVPPYLVCDRRASQPLLHALSGLDAERGTDLTRELTLIAAATHRTADERRTAEYLLRNRGAVISGERPAISLLRAARYAAEMDVRRIRLREHPVADESLAHLAAETRAARVEDPSVGEMVLDKLKLATGASPSTFRCRDYLLGAVAVALEVAERHAKTRGRTRPSLIAMRTDARVGARLVNQLRAEFGDGGVANRVARLLVGADNSPIETALLWWAARPDLSADDVPADVRARWSRDFQAVDRALSTTRRSTCQIISGVSS